MTGQLNTNLLNSNSEEIQEELDTLSNRLDGVESVASANTDKINEVDNKVIGSYCNDKAGYALATEVGNTKEEVVEKLFKTLKMEGYIEK